MNDDRAYLAHIRDAAERIAAFTAGGREAFFVEVMVQDAVMRNLEVIGEAVKHLSVELRSANRPPLRQRVEELLRAE